MNLNPDRLIALVSGNAFVMTPYLLKIQTMQINAGMWLGDLALKTIVALVLGVAGGAAGLIGKRIVEKIWKEKK